jgi:hypothetical protein
MINISSTEFWNFALTKAESTSRNQKHLLVSFLVDLQLKSPTKEGWAFDDTIVCIPSLAKH